MFLDNAFELGYPARYHIVEIKWYSFSIDTLFKLKFEESEKSWNGELADDLHECFANADP